MTDLADVLTPTTAEPEEWQPTDAQYAMARLAVHESAAADVRDQAAKMRADVNDWEQRELARIEPRIQRRRDQLTAYAMRLRTETGRKTLDLVSGTVRTATAGAHIEVDDREAVIAWASDQVLDVWNDPTLSVTKLRKALVIDDEGVARTADGERVPGVRVDPAGVRVSITTTSPELSAADPF